MVSKSSRRSRRRAAAMDGETALARPVGSAEKPKKWLRLAVDNLAQSSATVPLRWCVSPKAIEELKRRDVEKAFLLISVVSGGGIGGRNGEEVERFLVPLEQGMEYLQLHEAGRHSIHTFVVWAEGGSSSSERCSELQKSVLSRSRNCGSFNRRLYDYAGGTDFLESNLQDMLDHYNRFLSPEMTDVCLEVNVGAEFFAPEPKPWLGWWVNFFLGGFPEDQCSFRRRCIFAFTLQPPLILLLVLLVTLIRVVYVMLAKLWGIRDVQLDPIVHPFLQRTRDVCPGIYGRRDFFSARRNVFRTRSGGELQPYGLLFLHPLSLLVISTVAFGLIRLKSAVGGEATAAILLILAIVIGFVSLVSFATWKYCHSAAYLAKCREEEAKEQAEQDAKWRDRFRAVACDCGDEAPLARRKQPQTVYLRYKALKAKICRPFSRRSD